METITFNGEHLIPGNLGHFFVVLSFITALFGAIAFAMHVRTDNPMHKTIARATFFIHFVSVLGIIASLFYIIYNHYFEYQYAWQHSSLELPTHYMISCFWEGQEGSFLLWLFWEAVLGLAIVLKPSQWQSPVLAVVLLSQAVLSSMLLGIEIPFLAEYKFGSSPFDLMREVDISILEMPVLAMQGIAKSDYMQVIVNGTGLNPLLQNYWMVIHPPTLFFGFATTIIPFAFAIAGLWTRKYKEWMKPALPWALISIMVLGAGIIMGGVWAYESLSFGGYWAWDPVENASLIPWLVLIAAVHVMLINRITGSSLILSYLLVFGTFILVLYATFLTRSGVLGDTSVHSFTDLGLSRQLLVFLLMFVFLPVIVSFKASKKRWIYFGIMMIMFVINIVVGKFIVWLNMLFLLGSFVLFIQNFNLHLPLNKKEESIYSREFWMFVGSLVLLLSAIQIFSTTSIPVFNKITSALSFLFEPLYNLTNIEDFKNMAEGKVAQPIEIIRHYNTWQLPIAVIIAILTGITQFFAYRKTSKKALLRRFLIILGVAVVLTALLMPVFKLYFSSGFLLILFLFASVFAITGNAYFIYKALRFKWKLSGASLAHIGFGLMMIGVLVSSAKKQVISENRLYSYGENFSDADNRENILLYKDKPFKMTQYVVTYKGDTTIGPNTFYEVHYFDTVRNQEFSLYPNAQYSENQGLMPNPDTRHYLTRDIYTHVSLVPKSGEGEWESDGKHTMAVGDTMVINKSLVILEGIDRTLGDTISQELAGHDLHIARLKVITGDSAVIARPVFGVKDGQSYYNIFSIAEYAKIRFNYTPKEVEGVLTHELDTDIQPQRYIVMKAIAFPYINILWLGTVIMLIGFFMAIRRRLKENRK
ncbi:MAG: cytochrome c-type biogenesis protein CcmF [Bacteroidia bacterium]|jgi:cytochrome c-type biogenesis protein CcmF